MGCNSSNVETSKTKSNQPYLKLNSGYKIPQYGLGVFQIEGNEATEKACLAAFEIGIRHIDTAHLYQNERGVQFKKVKFQENNFLLLLNYGFPIMVKVLLQMQLIKC